VWTHFSASHLVRKIKSRQVFFLDCHLLGQAAIGQSWASLGHQMVTRRKNLHVGFLVIPEYITISMG
jgi:hypothetical protein